MMPLQSLYLMPARVIEHEAEALTFLLRDLLGHRVEKGLEYFGIAMRHDETHELTAGRAHCTDDILTKMTAIVSLGRSGTSLGPSLPGAWITFKSCFIAKENLYFGIFQ